MGLNSANYYNEPIVFVLQVLQSTQCIQHIYRERHHDFVLYDTILLI
jgi:hypothetical protein